MPANQSMHSSGSNVARSLRSVTFTPRQVIVYVDDVNDFRVERYLPTAATDITIDKYPQGFRAR